MAADGAASPEAGTRVVHVVRQFSPSVGGLEDAVMNLASYQQNHQGLDVRVVTLDRLFTDATRRLPRRDQIGGIQVRRIPWRGSRRYPLAPSVLRHVASADLLHVHGIDFFFDFLAATRPLHRRHMVASTHGGFFHTPYARGLKRKWFNTVTRRSLRAYDERMFRALQPQNLTMIENGINAHKFSGAAGGARDPKRLLTFGRFATHKRIETGFEILKILLSRGSGWTLVVAGSPWDQTENALRAQAAARGIGDHVRFAVLPTDDDLAAEVAAASFFLCASAHEGFGIAAVEAAAGGLIPVLSDIEPFVKLVDRLADGTVFPHAQPELAAAWIEGAIADPAQLAERRLAVSHRAQGYDWSSAAADHAALYASVLAQA
jgi:alpha-1,3-mannosyltransferase